MSFFPKVINGSLEKEGDSVQEKFRYVPKKKRLAVQNWDLLAESRCPINGEELEKTEKGYLCKECKFFVTDKRFTEIVAGIEERLQRDRFLRGV